jgi:hypothetical protein
MGMGQEDFDMLGLSLQTIRKTYGSIRDISLEAAVADLSSSSSCQGKKLKDTLGLDRVAEQQIISSLLEASERIYGKEALVISEECGRAGASRISPGTPVFISDPFDGSKFAESKIREHISLGYLGKVFDAVHEENGHSISMIVAPTTSFTMIRDGELKFSVVANLVRGDVFSMSQDGIYVGNPAMEPRESIFIYKQFGFREQMGDKMVCYCGREPYALNMAHTGLGGLFERDEMITFAAGPSRFSYLLPEAEEHFPDTGVLAYNGEPAQEFLPTLAAAFFSGGRLNAYKLCASCDISEDKGFKMTPAPEESMFSGMIGEKGLRLDVLDCKEYPSEYSDTLVVVPVSNGPAYKKMEQAVAEGAAMRLV